MRSVTFAIVAALLACKSQSDKAPAYCSEHRIESRVGALCISELAEFSDREGFSLGAVEAKSQIVHIAETPSEPKNVRRGPGRVDVRVCVMSGGRRGKTGYIPNTAIETCR